MLRVTVYASDATGCGHYRLVWPAQVAHVKGLAQVTVKSLKEGIRIVTNDRNFGDRVLQVERPDADVVVFQRLTGRRIHQIVPLLRAQGIAVVVDMDDDLSRIHPANPAFRAMSPRFEHQTHQSWEFAQKACDDATLVTVSTPALLKRYAVHGRGRVVYNCVPGWYVKQIGTHHKDQDVIGWGGAVFSHPDDVLQLAPVLARLGSRFRVVGPRDGVAKALRLTEERLEATGPVPIGKWAPVLSAALGIGVAPLADTKFNAAKSWLKPLEYSAVGIPWVGSALAEYRRLYQEGAGLLARTQSDWTRHLRTLQGSAAARQELAGRGLQVATRWTIEAQIGQWMQAWTDAVAIQRGAPVAAPAVIG